MIFERLGSRVIALAIRIQHHRIVHVGRLSGALRTNERIGWTTDAKRIVALSRNLACAVCLKHRSIDTGGAVAGVGSADGAKRICTVCDFAVVENTCTEWPVLGIVEGVALSSHRQIVEDVAAFANSTLLRTHGTAQAVGNIAHAIVRCLIARPWDREVGDRESSAVFAVEVVVGAIAA